MVQEVAEHKLSRLIGVPLNPRDSCTWIGYIFNSFTCMRLLYVFVICVFPIINGIFSSLLIQLTLHEDVEEVANG